jgi:hypothetical protein
MSIDTLRNVYQSVNDEPQTPNEIADKLNLNQKYSNLLEPANRMKHVRWKKIRGGGTCEDHPPRTFTMPILFNSDPIP